MNKAFTNNPIVGTTGFMPLTCADKWHKFMGGKCPIGNLFTDSLRWIEEDSDFAVLLSSGLRGSGWPAGNVQVSDIWSTFPFINYKCSGVMSGFFLIRYCSIVL